MIRETKTEKKEGKKGRKEANREHNLAQSSPVPFSEKPRGARFAVTPAIRV